MLAGQKDNNCEATLLLVMEATDRSTISKAQDIVMVRALWGLHIRAQDKLWSMVPPGQDNFKYSHCKAQKPFAQGQNMQQQQLPYGQEWKAFPEKTTD